jgi:N-methylhydantoinase A
VRDRARTGIDTGGTFTDFVVRERGRVAVHKRLSTPADPAAAVLAGLGHLFPEGVAGRVTYGSTVATNALLERRGARVCLVTTRGFEDVIEIGRQARAELYALEPRAPSVLVARADRLGVHERVAFDGMVVTPLTGRALRALVRRVRARRPQAIAVALLHAYARPTHERAIGRALAALGVPVALSHVLVHEAREYERTSTTVINAFVAPLMARHLARLASGRGKARLLVMQSNGGVVPPARAAAEPVRTVLSGPAAGVVGAAAVAQRAGVRRVLTLDMGGTSTDVALVDGAIPRRSDWEIDGMAVRVPVIDIHTVGAGGGSIARLDAGGALRVGPESAGADPGPACYGRGTAPTVTDANLVLGRLDPDAFLGGAMRLDARRAHDAIGPLARRLGRDVAAAAEGIVRVANAAMARALRVISVERGHDPRGFALLAFGGAAGVHACALADELGMREVLVPRHPGLLSALGMADAPPARDDIATVRAVDPTGAELAARFAALARQGRAGLRADGVAAARLAAFRFVRARYAGQSQEIEVPFAGGYRAAFDAAHERFFGYAAPGRPIEIVALRLTTTERTTVRRGRRGRTARRAAAPRTAQRHPLVWEGRRLLVPRFERERLAPGTALPGPALLLEYSSTVLVPPGWRARVDGDGNLRLAR